METLTGLTAADWAILSSLASIAGVVVAIVAGLIALGSYKASNRAAANGHMHSLFREYLRVRFDHQALVAGGKDDEGLQEETASLKLYVLEEMWAWVARQRSGLETWPLVGRLPHLRERKSMLDAWCKTIRSHIDIDKDEVIDNLMDATDCYGMGFLEFLAESGGDARFVSVWRDQVEKEARGSRTPFRPPTAPAPPRPRRRSAGS
jgi:hypothetical protein